MGSFRNSCTFVSPFVYQIYTYRVQRNSYRGRNQEASIASARKDYQWSKQLRALCDRSSVPPGGGWQEPEYSSER